MTVFSTMVADADALSMISPHAKEFAPSANRVINSIAVIARILLQTEDLAMLLENLKIRSSFARIRTPARLSGLIRRRKHERRNR
jgi:hypothetical protein